MKVSEIKGNEALDAIADILDPIMEITSDEEIESAWKSKDKQKGRIKAIQLMLRNHKEATITILAILDGEDPKTYEPSLLTLPKKLFEVFNDPDIASLFPSQEQILEKTSSGPVMATTKGNEV